MTTNRVTRARRALSMLCLLAAASAIAVWLTGGFVVRVESIRVSSRTPRNPLVLALISGLVAGGLALPDWRRAIRDDRAWFRQVGAAAIIALGHRWKRLQRVGVAPAIALVGIGLTIHQWAVARPLWLDEEMIALNLRDRALAELVGPLWLDQSAPFGWLALQRTVVLILDSERALRMVPVLFGIATIATALWVGRRWMGHVGAAVLVLLCSIGQWLSFYSLELKHYSADVFLALLLPALGAWAIDTRADGEIRQTRRLAIWWATAAVAHWFANGALLITPGCGLILMVILWRRQGWRAARQCALFGFIWAASFGLHYLIAVRHTLGSEYLRAYWSFALPPASAGVSGTLGWLASNLQPLASDPGGTGLWVTFWLCAACGFALRMHTTLGILLATVPLSAFALAALRIVPLYGRLSLWVVPALYFGIALFIDGVVKSGRDALIRRHWIHVAAAVLAAFIGLRLAVDIVRHGSHDIRLGRPPDENHHTDDRSAVRWLMRHHQPGDVVMTTHLTLPAVWWYGGIPISDRDGAGSRKEDGSRIFEVTHAAPGPECARNQLADVLKDRRLVLLYLGFGSDQPGDFERLLLRSLDELGVRAAFREFAQVGRAFVFDLRVPPAVEPRRPPELGSGAASTPGSPAGCIGVRPAMRW